MLLCKECHDDVSVLFTASVSMADMVGSKSRRKIPHTVTFSKNTMVTWVPMDNKTVKSYSEHDNERFRRMRTSDAWRMKAELKPTLTNTTTNLATAEMLYECLGLDALINGELMMQRAKHKRSHIDFVLAEQKRQKECGICDIDKLSMISIESSEWSRLRAHEVATAYYELCF